MELNELPSAIIIVGLLFLVIATVVMLNSNYKDAMLYHTLSFSDSILANNGSAQTLTASPIALTSVTAKNDTWLSFDGVNDYVSLETFKSENEEFLHLDNTFSFWINLSIENNARTIFELSGGDENNWTRCGINASGYLDIAKDSSSLGRMSNTTLNNSEWYHVLIRTNTSYGIDSIYINNFETVTNDLSSGYGTSTTNNIGRSTVSFNGTIDEFRIYNISLNTSQISEIYSSGRISNFSLPTDGLLLYLPLNENSGTDVHSFNETDLT